MNADELKICSYSNQGKELIENLKLNNDKQIIKWQILNSRNIQNLILNYIGFTPKTKKELKEAVKLWISNKKDAEGKYGNINTWNVHNITDMSNLFNNYYLFNDNINKWNVSNVTNMSYMFCECEEFNKPLNNWDVSNVVDMRYMFWYCRKFNQPLNHWFVNKVQNMTWMFGGCEKLLKKPKWFTLKL